MNTDRTYARLALATTAATYFLILVGGLVRAAGAGLGCPDWPRCFGRWIPPTNVSQLPPGFDPAQFNAVLTWLEYVNRLLGVSVGLLIAATMFVAIGRHRDRPRILWPSVAAALLVAYQGWLGGQVVRSGLMPWMVTAHLVVALLIVVLLMYATFHALSPRIASVRDRMRRRLGYLAGGAVGLLLVQIGLGTQVRAGIETALRDQPGLPRSEWLALVPVIDGLHRGLATAVALAVFALVIWTRRRFPADGALRRATAASAALLVTQLGAGWTLASMGLPAAAQVVHLSAASLLLGALVLIGLQAGTEGS